MREDGMKPTQSGLLTLGLLMLWLLLDTAGSSSVLTLSPPELIVLEGGDAIMTCSPFYPLEPLLLVHVQQDLLTVLTTSSEPRLTHEDFVVSNAPLLSNRTYTLKGVSRHDDNRRFHCVLGDWTSNEVTLRVYVPPILMGPSGLVYAMEGSPYPTNFHYKELLGLPPPHSFSWLLGGRPFHGNNRVSLLSGNKTLSVRNALRTDTGSYTIVVVSGSGEASLQLDLQITYNEFIVSPKNCIVETGEAIVLNCSHRFGLAYAWTTSRGPLSTYEAKVSLSADGRQLHYGPVNYTDHLLAFTCIAYSVDSENFFESLPAILSVQAPPQILITGPVEVSAVESESSGVILLFNIHSFPPHSSMVYQRDGKLVQFDDDRRVVLLSNGSVVIHNPAREDAGEYMLNVTNTHGTDFAAIILVIFYAPELVELYGPSVVQFNRTAIVPCGGGGGERGVGNPPPTFQWINHTTTGDRLLSDSPGIVSVNPRSGELMLVIALHEYSGSYSCTANNSIGSSSVFVKLLVLDPPGPPLHPVATHVGKTWAIVSWLPPDTTGSLAAISQYALTGSPRPNYGGVPLNEAEVEMLRIEIRNIADRKGILSREQEGLQNSACIEIVCESVRREAPSSAVMWNLTGLVPAVEYTVVLFAFSNGSILKSSPSQAVSFTTQNHVPGIGSVTSVVIGPGSANISWTLAYSGGLPVQQFYVEYRRNDTLTWRRSQPEDLAEGALEGALANSTISPDRRYYVVHELEAEEHYIFRVAGYNKLGRGSFTETTETLLSHHMGVPSTPTRPEILSWKGDCVTISTTISKLGSGFNFSLSSRLLLNGMVVSTTVGMSLPDNYSPSEEVEMTLANVSYRGDWTFVTLACNHLGCSLLSEPSLKARESIEHQTSTIKTVRAGVWSVMGVANTAVLAMSLVLCRVMSWEAKKRKKSRARRLEIVRDQSELSPRLIVTFGEFRSSPDGRSNNLAPTPSGSLVNQHVHQSVNYSPVRTAAGIA